MTDRRKLVEMSGGVVDKAGRGTIVIVGVCLISLGMELWWPHPLDVIGKARESAVANRGNSTAALPQLAPLSAFEAVTARPLFTSDRKPYRPPVEKPAIGRPVPVVAAPRTRFELNAVITTPSIQIALLKVNRSSEVQKLAVGESYEGWKLIEVRPAAVVLRKGSEVQTVDLNPDGLSNARPNARGPVRSGIR